MFRKFRNYGLSEFRFKHVYNVYYITIYIQYVSTFSMYFYVFTSSINNKN